MRILITGSRDWTDRQAIVDALFRHIPAGQDYGEITIVHGAGKGADWLARDIARAWTMHEEAHRADWAMHGKAAGPIRNVEMIDAGADLCLAFPKGVSKGTRHCMAVAEQAGIPVYNYGDPE